MLALTKLQACLTSSSAFFRCARCSDCCKSKTQATSILGLPGTVVCPDMSLCVPTLSVLEMPSITLDCEAAAQDHSYIKSIYTTTILENDITIDMTMDRNMIYQAYQSYRRKQKACCCVLYSSSTQTVFLSYASLVEHLED